MDSDEPDSPQAQGEAGMDPDELDRDRLAFSQDILDKRYSLYAWIDAKVNLSLVVNSVLLGLAYLVLERSSFSLPWVSVVTILLAILLIGIGVFCTLLLVVPAMRSPLWRRQPEKLIERQLRTTVGIEHFDPDEYREALKRLSTADMLRYNADQIKKMNHIVMVSSKRVQLVCRLSAIALLLLILGFAAAYISEWTELRSGANTERVVIGERILL